MPYSLRNRLRKQTAHAISTGQSAESDESSTAAESLSNDMAPKLTQTQDEQPVMEDDLSAAPPPPIRTTREHSRTTSPPQSLLNRYTSRTPKASLKTVTTQATYQGGKDAPASEDFNVAGSAMSSEWVDVPGTAEDSSDNDVQVCDGVEFEMMGKKGQAAEAPNAEADDEPSVYERRTTRSQSRRQQRADSADSIASAKPSTKEDNLVPPGLTVKKVSEKEITRTPSPQAVAGKDIRSPGQVGPTPSNSPSVLSTPSPPATTLVIDRTKNKAEYRLSTSPDPITLEKTVNHGLRRKLPQPPAKANALPVQVIPPIFNVNIRPEHIWTSPLASTSRPDSPWEWMKVWTCCRCAYLDPTGRDRAAETMVEQSVCSRLVCQHERCASGCRLIRKSGNDVSHLFL